MVATQLKYGILGTSESGKHSRATLIATAGAIVITISTTLALQAREVADKLRRAINRLEGEGDSGAMDLENHRAELEQPIAGASP